MELEEKKTGSELIYDGRLLHVYRDTVSLPNGNTSDREYIKHVGAVCIIPIDENGNIILERQYRYPTGQILIEIPAGKLNSKDEDPLKAAQRELREETGITAGKYTELGYFYPACAYSDEKIMMYIAQDLTFGETDPDADEFLDIFKMPVDELVREVERGNIMDIKTQAAALRAARFLEKQKGSK